MNPKTIINSRVKTVHCTTILRQKWQFVHDIITDTKVWWLFTSPDIHAHTTLGSIYIFNKCYISMKRSSIQFSGAFTSLQSCYEMCFVQIYVWTTHSHQRQCPTTDSMVQYTDKIWWWAPPVAHHQDWLTDGELLNDWLVCKKELKYPKMNCHEIRQSLTNIHQPALILLKIRCQQKIYVNTNIKFSMYLEINSCITCYVFIWLEMLAMEVTEKKKSTFYAQCIFFLQTHHMEWKHYNPYVMHIFPSFLISGEISAEVREL